MSAVTNETKIKKLATWIQSLIEAAKNDLSFSVSWFAETMDKPFSIVGGWMEGFSEDYADILCISKSEPKYAMCVKVVVNEGPGTCTDFELMTMPVDKNGEVDDTCLALDKDYDPAVDAIFMWNEWERIMKEHGVQEVA